MNHSDLTGLASKNDFFKGAYSVIYTTNESLSGQVYLNYTHDVQLGRVWFDTVDSGEVVFSIVDTLYGRDRFNQTLSLSILHTNTVRHCMVRSDMVLYSPVGKDGVWYGSVPCNIVYVHYSFYAPRQLVWDTVKEKTIPGCAYGITSGSTPDRGIGRDMHIFRQSYNSTLSLPTLCGIGRLNLFCLIPSLILSTNPFSLFHRGTGHLNLFSAATQPIPMTCSFSFISGMNGLNKTNKATVFQAICKKVSNPIVSRITVHAYTFYMVLSGRVLFDRVWRGAAGYVSAWSFLVR